MKCKNCKNFKSGINFEAASEISPNIRAMKGKCGIDDKDCKPTDKCGCGGFSKK